MSDLLITRRGFFSECGLYHYELEHGFGFKGPVISLGMLNPSDVDGGKSETTLEGRRLRDGRWRQQNKDDTALAGAFPGIQSFRRLHEVFSAPATTPCAAGIGPLSHRSTSSGCPALSY